MQGGSKVAGRHPLFRSVVQPSTQDVLVDSLAELHHFLQIFSFNVVLARVGLGHHEHLIVLLPELHEVSVFLDNQVYNE